MSEWDNIIQSASFGGIEFEVISCNDKLGRRVVEHEYLGKDGADLEDTGGIARPASFVAAFHGDGYLVRLTELQRLFITGETRTLQHPLFGVWQAKALSMDISHESAKRDGCTVNLEFKEDGTNTTIPAIQAISAAEQELTEAVTAVNASYSELDETVPAVDDLTTNAGTYADDMENATSSRADRFAELNSHCKSAVTDVDDSDADDMDTWPVIRDIRSLQFAARQMRESYDAARPSIVDHAVAVDMPASALAAYLYGDVSRVGEILALNKITNTFMIPAGTVLKVHGA